jgi:outer membrane protein OmpA-like peptidoglycan-associated protein
LIIYDLSSVKIDYYILNILLTAFQSKEKGYIYCKSKSKINMATEIQDDYLVCGEYKEQIAKKSAEYPGFITFQHSNGNHYFAWVNGDEIVMRSEAYPDAEKMERGIKAILKNCDLTERYSTFEEHGAHFLVLWGGGDHTAHTGNRSEHSEIGRSCPHKTREELNAMMQFKGNDFADKVVPLASASKANTTMAAAATVATAAAGTVVSATNSTEKIGATMAHTAAETSTGGGMGWLKWLLPLLLIGAALLWWKGCNKTADVNADAAAVVSNEPTIIDNGTTATMDTGNTNATNNDATAATVAAVTTAQSTKVKLACGSEIDAYQGGIEANLVKFLDNKAAPFNADDKKANWINFDNMNFEFGTSKLTGESIKQIKNLVAILECYKGLKIKIGGYTDKVGPDAGNMKLSQSRADAILKALKDNGAKADQLIGAEGYGETLATVAETATDEARAVDRKTAVRIMAR